MNSQQEKDLFTITLLQNFLLKEKYLKVMNNTVVLTSIYSEFWGTHEFKKSCERVGLPVHNAWKTPGRFTGHADTFRYDYEALLELDKSYKFAIYADGADSLFLKSFKVPSHCMIYSCEKAIWPPTQQMNEAWASYYDSIGYPSLQGFKDPLTTIHTNSPWKYLNGGGWCGPIPILIEFFQRYGLNKLKGDINGQDYQALAFLKAQKEGFPIFLDTQCQFFQTTGFEHQDDFEIDPETKTFRNKITGFHPSILHGNGRTDMTHLYKTFNQ
jgi:hypothetical protein